MKYSKTNKTKRNEKQNLHEKESKSKINRRFIYFNLFHFSIALVLKIASSSPSSVLWNCKWIFHCTRWTSSEEMVLVGGKNIEISLWAIRIVQTVVKSKSYGEKIKRFERFSVICIFCLEQPKKRSWIEVPLIFIGNSCLHYILQFLEREQNANKIGIHLSVYW